MSPGTPVTNDGARPARSRRGPRRLRGVLAAGIVACGLAACGAQPPQAPLADAKKLDVATSGISTACGKAYLLRAFGGPHPAGLRGLEATASVAVRKLALVEHRNPAWIYQGSTVRTIVGDSVSMLGSCGLQRARAELLRATRRR